jgi:hypothetical protein
MKTREEILAEDHERLYGRTVVYDTVEAFAEASGLSVEAIEKNGIRIYNNYDKETGIGRYELKVPGMVTKTKVLEIHHRGDSVRVIVDTDTDLDQPFTGECLDTGEQLHFRQPWALDIEVVGNGVSAVV